MSLSYEYSIGSVRARENSLFKSTDIEHMLNCENEEQVVKYLVDKGYGEGYTIDEVINSHTESMWNYIKSVAPDFSLFNPFFYLNDIHNLKVVLKGTMAAREYDSLLIKPCTIACDVIKKAVEGRRFSLLPQWLCEPASKAYELLAYTKDARLCDAVIDKAVMEQLLISGEKSHSKFLDMFFKTTVFYNNIKILIRGARTGTTEDFLRTALCDVQGFSIETAIKAALKGTDSLIDTLSKSGEYDLDKAMKAYSSSPSEFEKFVDDKIMVMAKEDCKLFGSGPEPLLGYYLACETEKKVIHIITSGLRTKTDREIIRERLREIYV